VIRPKLSEEDWSGFLNGLPLWQPTEQSIVLLAPHPDDETLGAGGFLAAQCLRSIDVTVVAVTDGENAYAGHTGLAAIRRPEQVDALGRLGVSADKITRLGLRDSDVKSQVDELVERLIPLVCETTHLLAPWRGDFHPDHEACGSAAEEVARRTGARLTSYFFWTWHLGNISLVSDLPLRSFPLTEETMEAKAEALSCHRSQLEHSSGAPILPEDLLGPARRPFEVFSVQ
jgi:LmbE family N-acetylglucosaminyl deacetylase